MRWLAALALALVSGLATPSARAQTPPAYAKTPPAPAVAREVARVVRPVMQRYGIPGMAVGITFAGRHYVADFGLASKASGTPVAPGTLFEIGSISKTFTAALVAYAQGAGKLSLADRVSADLPTLRGSAFDDVRLVDLGTYTAGGLPLQFPDAIRTDADALRYYRTWQTSYAPGTVRLYSNPSIMLLGLIAASRLHADFATALERIVLAPLGLRDTFLAVPPAARARYAQGYTESGTPRRLALGALALEAYGIRTTASDMLRFLDANLGEPGPGGTLRKAIVDTHTAYVRIDGITQDLVWEQYAEPTSLSDVLRGNSERVLFEKNRVVRILPPKKPRSDAFVDKTGSTSGFAAYTAFIPSRKIGIVLLANRSYPIEARVTTAYRMLARLEDMAR